MAMFADCPGCSSGDHDSHVAHWGVRPEGVIDGDFCVCSGDCAERHKTSLQKLLDAMFNPQPEKRLLADAVVDYLDEFYAADMSGDRIPWPQELVELSGWTPPK